MMKKAVFLDRDGVLLGLSPQDKTYGYVYKKEDVVILPGVPEALHNLKRKGYLLIVATNQPVIARGIATYEEMVVLHEFVNQKLQGAIDRFYLCPHHPEMHDDVPEHARKYRIPCDCRKPAAGMLMQAAKDFQIDLEKSWMIGDMVTDIAAGESAGCKTIMIKSESNNRIIITKTPLSAEIKPMRYADSLLEATRFLKSNIM